jgi:hypothetical protein
MIAMYDGYRITTSTPNHVGTIKVPNVIYRVERKEGNSWKLAHEGVLYGPFNSNQEALEAAAAVAHK